MAKNYDIPDINLRFGEVFKDSRLSQKEFGEIFGLKQNQVSNILLGKRGVTPMLIRMLCLKLNVSEDWLTRGIQPMYREDPEIEAPGIPLLADIPAGDWRYWIDSYPTNDPESWLPSMGLKGSHLFAIRVDGDSMEPRLHQGDILVINPSLKYDSGIGVVRHKGGYKIRTIRRLQKNKYLLVPLNSEYETEEVVPDKDTRFYKPVKVISMQDI